MLYSHKRQPSVGCSVSSGGVALHRSTVVVFSYSARMGCLCLRSFFGVASCLDAIFAKKLTSMDMVFEKRRRKNSSERPARTRPATCQSPVWQTFCTSSLSSMDVVGVVHALRSIGVAQIHPLLSLNLISRRHTEEGNI